MCFPNLLEKWIKLKNIDAKESLIFNNFILNLQQMKSVILMFVLSSAIFKDREGITAGVKKCRKAIDEAVMKYQL